MARNPTTQSEQPTPAPAHEAPKAGGSYRRDPLTGELTLVEQTKPAPDAGEIKE